MLLVQAIDVGCAIEPSVHDEVNFAQVLADKIYRTRENLQYCKTHGIRWSGPALGRPVKEERKEQKRQAKLDAAERNAVEEKIGEGKRIYGLGLIKA